MLVVVVDPAVVVAVVVVVVEMELAVGGKKGCCAVELTVAVKMAKRVVVLAVDFTTH